MLLFTGCNSQPPNPGARTEPAALTAVQVVAAKPGRKTLEKVSEQPGQILPFEETPIHAMVSGYANKVLVDIGDRVKVGQPLAELAVPELHDELAQKEALLEQSKAERRQAQAAIQAAEAKVVTAEAGVREAEAARTRVEADLARWQSEYQRFAELAKSSAVTNKLVDETRQQLHAAEAGRLETRAKIESAKAGRGEAEAVLRKAHADEAAATARVGVAEANLQQTRTLLAYAQLHAPYDGVVTRRNLHTGHLVPVGERGEPLFVVARTDPVRVVIEVPEADAALVHPGSRVRFRVKSLGEAAVEAKVTRLAWALDERTRIMRAEIDVPNAAGRLHAGMYVAAAVVLEERPNVLVLPATALLVQDGKSACFCVENNRIVRKPVTVGLRTGGECEITVGLSGDDVVVQTGAASLKEGQAVQVSK